MPIFFADSIKNCRFIPEYAGKNDENFRKRAVFAICDIFYPGKVVKTVVQKERRNYIIKITVYTGNRYFYHTKRKEVIQWLEN